MFYQFLGFSLKIQKSGSRKLLSMDIFVYFQRTGILIKYSESALEITKK